MMQLSVPIRRVAIVSKQPCLRGSFVVRRSYQNVSQPHKTYFQDPSPPQPPRRRLRTFFGRVLFGTTCAAIGVVGSTWLLGHAAEELLQNELAGSDISALGAFADDAQSMTLAREVPPTSREALPYILRSKAGFSVTPTAVSHFTQLGSNLPCEDAMGSGTYTFHSEHFNDSSRDWSEWGIYDGHAGPRTSTVLKQMLPLFMGGELWENKCMNRPYTPNDDHIISTIKKAFVKFDNHLLEEAEKRVRGGAASRSDIVSMLANVMSGSCALFAIFDPKHAILRVANLGDSRAVLGRWDRVEQKYVAKAMSVDQTGFNQAEVDRISKEHPGEDVIDPKTGRVHGIMVSRAFGDARWKWPQELNKLVHEKFWGPKPRPDKMILTPPYLTAEPEVMEVKVQSGDHPDFLIMASDGFWDNVSNDDAVACVQLWLDKNSPMDFIDRPPEDPTSQFLQANQPRRTFDVPSPLTYTKVSDMVEDEDTFWDAEMGALRWRVSPKHFVNEDENCGVHLVQNALGGKRRDLLEGVVTVQPPLSRNVRDDISVNVIFFGVDASKAVQEMQAAQPASALHGG